MSVQAITCALAVRGVTASEKLVLLALANYADENMRCWPSQARLADDTCLTERTMRTVLASLEQRRLISRKERRRQDGTRASDVITLHFSGEVTEQAEIISASQQPEDISAYQPEIHVANNRKSTSDQPENISGLTTFEPSKKNHQKEPSDRARARPSRRMPDGYVPNEATLSVGAELGFTPGEIDRELSKIRDHQFRDAHTDWDAVTRNWLRRAAENHRATSDVRPNHNHRQTDRDSRLQRMLAGAVAAADGPDDELSAGVGLRRAMEPRRIGGRR